MRKVTILDELTLKDINYTIQKDEVIIISNGQSPSIVCDIFLKNYYYNHGKLPSFEKFIIKRRNSSIILDRKEFYKNLPHQTIGSLIKLDLIEWKI